MNLPPLNLVEGCLFIDNSSIEKWKCPRLWEYSELHLKSAVAEKAGANFGSTIHRGLETRYNLCGNGLLTEHAINEIEIAMRGWLEANPQPPGDFRDFNHACKMMRVYNQIYRQESFDILKSPSNGKPIIESSFAIPFAIHWPSTGVTTEWTPGEGTATAETIVKLSGIPIYYCGKIDLGITDANGIWSFDHKTAFQFGEAWNKQMQVDGGQRGYCWALGQVLGKPATGYIIDGIRVRRPSVKGGFLGESPIDGTDFVRLPNYVSADDLAGWKEDTMSIIKSILAAHSAGHFPKHRWHCTNKYGTCEFFDVCSTPRAQRHLILNSNLFEANEWSKGLKTNANKESEKQ